MGMSATNDSVIFPKSPLLEVGGIPYFARLCDKVRLHAAGNLADEYKANLGRGFDRWTCDYLGVSYEDLVGKVLGGLSDDDVLKWAVSEGGERTEVEREWWLSYMRNRGYNDDLSEVLEKRKLENGLGDRDDVVSFFGLIDADEGRI